MLNIYAQSFLEASRFSANTRPDPQTLSALQKTADRKTKKRFFQQEKKPRR